MRCTQLEWLCSNLPYLEKANFSFEFICILSCVLFYLGLFFSLRLFFFCLVLDKKKKCPIVLCCFSPRVLAALYKKSISKNQSIWPTLASFFSQMADDFFLVSVLLLFFEKGQCDSSKFQP